jgi:hypothetical protein
MLVFAHSHNVNRMQIAIGGLRASCTSWNLVSARARQTREILLSHVELNLSRQETIKINYSSK